MLWETAHVYSVVGRSLIFTEKVALIVQIASTSQTENIESILLAQIGY